MTADTLDQLHQHLNRSDVVPVRYYWRNHMHYPLVCYINNIVGLYLSANYAAIPIFIQRAHRHLEKVQSHEKPLPSEPYLELVRKYLSQMARFIFSLESVDEAGKGMIPSELL